jgi:hypothetical protein
MQRLQHQEQEPERRQGQGQGQGWRGRPRNISLVTGLSPACLGNPLAVRRGVHVPPAQRCWTVTAMLLLQAVPQAPYLSAWAVRPAAIHGL